MPATLPTDHRVRAPVPADDAAVLRVMLARDVADLGHPDFTLEDLRADWATPGLDLARDAWVVEDAGGRIVASALLLADYWPAQHYLRMRVALAEAPPAPGLPVRTFERDHDELEVHRLLQEAFSEVEGFA